MIGVICHDSETAAAAEFFELFKTEWELSKPSRHYDVLLRTAKAPPSDATASLTIRYEGPEARPPGHGAYSVLRTEAGSFPVYRGYIPLSPAGETVLTDADGHCAGTFCHSGDRWEARLGYDLFGEVERILTQGQPEEFAATPTLELHIELLRQLIRRSGQTCREVRPFPKNYRFIAALTHDVDHPSLRLHGLDRTASGFALRGLFGSIRDFVRRMAPLRHVFRNWKAVAALPFVWLGWARDEWRDFITYPQMERGRASTFFVLPFAGLPGKNPSGGAAPPKRAAAYGAADVSHELAKLRESGCEIALHGIDAWSDPLSAERERQSVENASGSAIKGVRIHWLYWSDAAAQHLDRAGFDYDSTFGYNSTVGFRAGTAQAFRPVGANSLIELPLVVMDTALFFPSHLDLCPADAWREVMAIVDEMERFGGCLTVNWHDRSLFPERLWGQFYRDLVVELERRGAWITTASDAVRWFRRRRQVFSGSHESNEADLPELEIDLVSAASENAHNSA